ncbi:unnamed protein product [Ixodes pacificus]
MSASLDVHARVFVAEVEATVGVIVNHGRPPVATNGILRIVPGGRGGPRKHAACSDGILLLTRGMSPAWPRRWSRQRT